MKYAALTSHLANQATAEVPMTFAEIERVIDARLPEKASKHRAWWSNNPSNNVMTKAWLAAGYQSERVDMASRRLVFRRMRAALPPTGPKTPIGSTGASGADRFAAIYGAMRGSVVIHGDITQPTGERWDADE